MKISFINVILNRNKLIYVIHTPIPIEFKYKVYRFTPVPMKGWRKYYIYDDLSDNPVAVNMVVEEFTIIDVEMFFI